MNFLSFLDVWRVKFEILNRKIISNYYVGFYMKNIFLLTALGSVGGYAYYYLIGCNGTCSITNSPINSVVYGAIVGFVLSIPNEKKPKNIKN